MYLTRTAGIETSHLSKFNTSQKVMYLTRTAGIETRCFLAKPMRSANVSYPHCGN